MDVHLLNLYRHVFERNCRRQVLQKTNEGRISTKNGAGDPVNNQLNIPVGISDFKKIRENDYYYIDKSGLIKELLKRESAEVTLIIRPRRFGKTMGMSMLAHFFDIRSDNRRLFDGLEIKIIWHFGLR